MISTPFGITAATNLVSLDAQNRGRAAFTVSNRSGQVVSGRAELVPTRAEEHAWLAIDGDAERRFPADTTQQYSVRIAVAPGTPTGRHSFRLDMTAVNPPIGVTEGPTVVYEVTTAVPIPKGVKPGYVATLVGAVLGAAAGALVGAIPGAIIAIVTLGQHSSTSADTISLVVGIGVLVVSIVGVFAGAWLNLRGLGYGGALQTGLILAGIYAAWALVLEGAFFAISKVPSANVGGLGLPLALIIVLAPPVPARFIYLRLKAMGRLN